MWVSYPRGPGEARFVRESVVNKSIVTGINGMWERTIYYATLKGI